jgi:serine/threonine-protein kinase
MWTPDGQRLLFSSLRSGTPSLYIKNADGTGEVEQVTEPTGSQRPVGWSSDGETLVLTDGNDIHTVKFGSETVTSALFETTFTENRGSLSPDGNWLAYESDEDGDTDVYVRPFPDVDNGKWKVSAQGGTHPYWSPDGEELFFFQGNEMMAAPISTVPAFGAGNPVSLFEGRYNLNLLGRAFAVTPDGTGFIATKSATGDNITSVQNLVAVFNWFEELKERVPVP